MQHISDENNILTDYSGFKWMSFIPGETSVDDISVMKISTTQGRFASYIIPENFNAPTYCIQIITSGFMHADINHQHYKVETNGGFLTTPDFLMGRPKDTDNHVELYCLALSRKFMQDMNIQFPLSLISYVYVHPTWQMSSQKTQRSVQYMELLREVVAENNREAALLLVNSFFHYLSGEVAHDMTIMTAMSRNEEITGRFMHLVDTYCEQQHSLDWYADQLCLSTRYVANTVKETLGMTASACLERALMQRAKTLLYTTNKSIQEIADQLGFQNQSHFGTFFKRHESISPAAFRKNSSK